jgi:amino-acid N-acetyltransferase
LRAADLPIEDLTDFHLQHFFIATSMGSAVGLVGLELHGRDALLRSLVVDRHARTKGIGTRLVDQAEAHARICGIESIYLLTTTAERFFAHRGYARIERNIAPESIRTTREFSSLCPTNSALMLKHLQA